MRKYPLLRNPYFDILYYSNDLKIKGGFAKIRQTRAVMTSLSETGRQNFDLSRHSPVLKTLWRKKMKTYRKELWFEVPTRRAFINITPHVEACLGESGIKEGFLLANAMHITASVFINDDESGLHHDYDIWLEKLAPHEPVSGYRHNVGEDNADAHMKRQIMGREVVVAVTKGRLDFGPWEQIFYGEFDGRRKKRVLIKIIGE